jgi:hypothetical protein
VSELLTYLVLVWGDALVTDPGLWIVGWELARKTSFSARSVDDLARWLEQQNERSCVYVHAGLVRFFTGSRPSVNDIACVPGLWADIDVRGPVHAEQHLPPSLDVVRSFLTTLPLAPSVVVFTGHGVLAWWLFNEPFFIDTRVQRGEIARLSVRWQAFLRQRLGYAMDHTADLCRLTRPAGVVNRKSAPVVTRIVEQNARRYSLDDFRDVGLPQIDVASTDGRARGQDAKFPPARLEPIIEGCAWQVTAIGRANIWSLHARAAELGGHLRTGLEDTFYLPDGRKARGNGELVEALADCARAAGRAIASPAEARVLMGLAKPPVDLVSRLS